MALTPEEEAELAELEKQVSPELRALAAPPSGAAVDQPPTPGSEEKLGGIKAVYDRNWTPHGPGGQPISQTELDKQRDEAALQAEAERVAGMLDPRFSLVPQVLALQPATNDLQGDEAAKAKFEAGQRDVVTIYEPPVDVVRQQLLQNPALLRAISPDSVPTQQEIAGLTADSRLYEDASNWMYKQAQEAADAKGVKIARYRDTPWLTLDPKELAVKFDQAAPELANRAQAFILGVDDMGAAGAGRAVQEFAEPESRLTQPRLGVNESVPHPSAEVNAWTEETYPLEYGAGQAVGMLNPRGVFNQLWRGLQSGAGTLAQMAAKTRLGGLAGAAPAPVKAAAGVVADTAVGTAGAAAGQALQEGVDAAARGELPGADAAERIVGTAKTGGYLSAGGSVFGQLAGRGAEGIRDSPRFSGPRGPGAVRRTEANMEYRLGREPRLSGETRELVKRANATGDQAGDLLTEEIAGPIGKAARENTTRAEGRARAEVANAQRTPEGSAPLPMTHLQERSLERLRDHHQPQPGGGLHPVDDKHRGAAKVFNGLVEDVSTTPIEGAVKLDPDEAASFLGPRQRYQLLKKDIEAANQNAGKAATEKLDREAYLDTIKDSRARAAADEEIEASIEDIVGDVTPTPARRAAAEQQVLRELVEEASFTEVNGSLADYLRQRGVDAVYVKPRAYDARRADTLTKGLTDEDLAAAAKIDRQRRPLDGKKGGYDQLIKKGEAEVEKARAVEKSVAPGGDAFGPIAGLYQSHPGQKQLVDQVRALAEQTGTTAQLGRLRGLQETLAIQNRASFRGAQGQSRYAPTNFMDAAQLRFGFPALRALEGPLGPLRGGTAGRAALLGSETDDRQEGQEASARSRYGALRDQRLREIAAKKEADAKEDQRRQNETIQRRR